MSNPFPARPPRWLQAVLVFLATVACTALLFQRTTWSDWTEPHWLEGDPVEVYARVKLAAEQPGAVLGGSITVENLGAPVRADWTGYPVPDRIVFVLTGWLAGALGLIAAIQLMSACLLALNATSFYLCARWLRWRWEWATALALAFAFCTYNVRWGITLSFSQTFVIPPLLLLCARATRRGAKPAAGWSLLAIALGFWLAQGNPYLAYFAGVVAGGALLLAWLRRIPRLRLVPLGLFLGVLTVGFFLLNAAQIRSALAGSETASLLRGADDMRTFALRPIEWLVPPADHRLPLLGGLGRKYHDHVQGRGELYYNYLGLLGIAGLVGLLAVGVRRLARKSWRHGDAVLGLVWIIVFGMAGGINHWLGAAGLDLFRAGTRIGIYAQVWTLRFLGGWLMRRFRTKAVSLPLALLVAAAAIWEQTPPLGDPAPRERNFARWQDYATLTEKLERALPPGAMVFQLPATAFPEAGRTGAMPDYEHLLPYLTSDTLRYSYGHLRNSPALRWARHVARLPTTEMVAALEGTGFAALWIDTRAYADAGAALSAALQDAGRSEFTVDRQPASVRVFLLKPAPAPQLPDFSDPRLQEPWDETSGQPALLALRGWYAPESDAQNRWRWAAREAALGLWSETAAPTATLRFRLGGPAQSVVVLRLDGRELGRWAPGPETRTVQLPLGAGLTTLIWSLEGHTFRPGDHDPRELGFMVENLAVSVP